MMRVSVTVLDSFRLFRDYDFIEQDEMVARIRREPVEPNYKMYLGSALHKVLDTPERFRDGGFFEVQPEDLRQGEYKPDCEFRFDSFGIDQVLKELPDGITELKTEYEIGGVNLVGIADRIWGTTIYDWKVTTKAPKPDNFAESCQWRAYLEMFSCDRFIYCPIQVRKESSRGVTFYTVEDFSQFEHYRYPAMRDDLLTLIAEYVEFARMMGLEQAS